MNRKPCLKILSLAIVMMAATTTASAKRQDLRNSTLEDVALSSLKYISSEQISEYSTLYQRGEWPTYILSTLLPRMVGVGKLVGHDQEATAFTTAAVVNAISSIYFEYPHLQAKPAFQDIKSMVNKAVPTFAHYQEGELFNFYPPKEWKGKRVHQPIEMSLLPMWKGFTNVPEDADTTSAVYTSKLYHARMNGKEFEVPRSVLKSIATYRDLNRKPQFYNKREERIQTGAFMTWLADENDPNAPRFYFAPPEKGARIPFNRNDVDCIVNLNVLRMLALNKGPEIAGQKQACEMINDMIAKQEHATCGIYYPNTFNLAYSATEIEKAAAQCIASERKIDTVDFILKRQSEDGGWDNENNIWIDRVQSTAFAMNALLEFGDASDVRVQGALRYGVRFLLSNSKLSRNQDRYWKGELFFTATALARSLISWKSNSFTTAVVAAALLKTHEKYPNLKLEDYIGNNGL